jgi:hypothetical protein
MYVESEEPIATVRNGLQAGEGQHGRGVAPRRPLGGGNSPEPLPTGSIASSIVSKMSNPWSEEDDLSS